MPDTSRGPYTIDDDIEGALADVGCPTTSIRVRVLDPWILQLLRRELEFMGEKPKWPEHRYLVRAGGSVKNGRASLHADILDRSTGQTIARVSVSRAATGREIWDVEQELARRLAAKACLPARWDALASGERESSTADGLASQRDSFSAAYKLVALPPDQYEHDPYDGGFELPGEVEAFYEVRGTFDARFEGRANYGPEENCSWTGSATGETSGLLLLARVSGDPISSWPIVYGNAELQYVHQLEFQGMATETNSCHGSGSSEYEDCWQSDWGSYSLDNTVIAFNRSGRGFACGPFQPEYAGGEGFAWGAGLRFEE